MFRMVIVFARNFYSHYFPMPEFSLENHEVTINLIVACLGEDYNYAP